MNVAVRAINKHPSKFSDSSIGGGNSASRQQLNTSRRKTSSSVSPASPSSPILQSQTVTTDVFDGGLVDVTALVVGNDEEENAGAENHQHHQQAADEIGGAFPEPADPSFDLQSRITLNISGLRFETFVSTLEKFPNTLLGNAAWRNAYFDASCKEYYFERNRACFDAILYYYQSGGRLKKPDFVPADMFYEECLFFRLDREAIIRFRFENGFETKQRRDSSQTKLPSVCIQRFFWLLLEYPESSKSARGFAILSVLTICLSIGLFCIETLPHYRQYQLDWSQDSNNPTVISQDLPELSEIFFVMESACICWFTCELLCRFFSCPEKLRFFSHLMNVVDLVSIVPYYITLGTLLTSNNSNGGGANLSFVASSNFRNFSDTISKMLIIGNNIDSKYRQEEIAMINFSAINKTSLKSSVIFQRLTNSTDSSFIENALSTPLSTKNLLPPNPISQINAQSSSTSNTNKAASFSVLRVIRLLRVFRIFKLSRHSKGLQILAQTLKSSISELSLLAFFLVICVVLFSSAIYFVELESEHTYFRSIPEGFWWAVVTMTLVGYGDITPVTMFGKLVGSVCAISGVLTVALPVPVVVSNFNYYYQREILQNSGDNEIFYREYSWMDTDTSNSTSAATTEGTPLISPISNKNNASNDEINDKLIIHEYDSKMTEEINIPFSQFHDQSLIRRNANEKS